MGTTLFKDAHARSDYLRVEEEFSKAIELAPSWPEAHYNLALVHEAEAKSGGDELSEYMEAIVQLAIYVELHQTWSDIPRARLSEGELEKVADKIYEFKAKAQKALGP